MHQLGIDIKNLELDVEVDFGTPEEKDIRRIPKITLSDKNRYQFVERDILKAYEALGSLQMRMQALFAKMNDENVNVDSEEITTLEEDIKIQQCKVADLVDILLDEILVKYIPEDLMPQLKQTDAGVIIALWNVLLYGEPQVDDFDPNEKLYDNKKNDDNQKKTKK